MMDDTPAITWRDLAACAGVAVLVYVLLAAAFILAGGAQQ